MLLAAALTEPTGGSPSPGTRDTGCPVVRIVDGDTFYCGAAGRIRLIGIDAPERGQGEPGAAALAALERLLPRGTAVRLEGDVVETDRFGRRLAYVWVGDTLVNEALVRGGWAVLLTVPPNVKYVARFERAQRAAREDRAGLWSGSAFDCAPADWRQGRC